jgi:leukotriene-A4 hydrolase
LGKIDFLAWIKGAELPVKPHFTSEELEKVFKLANDYIALGGESSPEGFEAVPNLFSLYIETFLRYLLTHKSMTLKIVERLDKDHDFTHKFSKEIRCCWFKIALTHKYEPAYPEIYEFLGSNGRIKYIRPIYALLDKIDHNKAVELFNKHEGFYHNLLVHMLKKILF